MASITPITAYQNSAQSTGSTTPVDANCETSALANGIDYLVRYCGNVGGTSTSINAKMRLLFGSTVIAEVSGEGRGTGSHWDSVQCQGYAKITGNGTDTLKFQFWGDASSVYAGAMAIVAIPLDDLTENTDYWFSGTNSSSNEVSDASTSWETLRSQAFTLPDNGDYLVLMSAEGNPSDSGSASELVRLRWFVDSTYLCPTNDSSYEHSEEWEDNADWFGYSIATLVNLNSGSRTFKIECASGATAEANYRRSNIWVFRKASFDQITQTQDTSGASTSSATYVDFSGLNTTYTPNQQEYVLALGYVVVSNSTFYTGLAELYNDSDSTEFCIDSGEYGNGYYAQLHPTVLTYCGQYSVAKNWKVRYRIGGGGTAYIGLGISGSGGIESNLIFWGLTTAAGGTTRELTAAIAGSSSTPNDIAPTTERELTAALSVTSSTPNDVVATATRLIVAAIINSSSTPIDIVAALTRALTTAIAISSTTPNDIDVTSVRTLLSAIAAGSATPDDVEVTLTRLLAASIVGSSTIPDDVSEITTRALSSAIPGVSSTPDDIVSTSTRTILAAPMAASSTPDDVVASLARSLLAAISGASTTPDDVIATLGETISLIATVIATSTTPDDISRTITRSISADVPGISATPDDVVASLARSLLAAIAGISTTPDDVEAILGNLISLVAAIVGGSSTPDDVEATIIRSLAAAIAGNSVTPDDVEATIEKVISLVTAIAASSSTPADVIVTTVRSLIAAIVGVSTTPDIEIFRVGAFGPIGVYKYDNMIRKYDFNDDFEIYIFNDSPIKEEI